MISNSITIFRIICSLALLPVSVFSPACTSDFLVASGMEWEATVPYIEKNKLDVWTHNKTIQKARESYRITDEQKEYLKSLKRK